MPDLTDEETLLVACVARLLDTERDSKERGSIAFEYLQLHNAHQHPLLMGQLMGQVLDAFDALMKTHPDRNVLRAQIHERAEIFDFALLAARFDDPE